MNKLPPYFRRAEKSSIGVTGRKSEKRVAKNIGGRLTPNSGAVAHAKGDISLKDALVEAKSTTGRSISIQHEWLGKIAAEARAQGKTPALTVSFTNADGRPVPNGSWIMIPLVEWQDMRGDE